MSSGHASARSSLQSSSSVASDLECDSEATRTETRATAVACPREEHADGDEVVPLDSSEDAYSNDSAVFESDPGPSEGAISAVADQGEYSDDWSDGDDTALPDPYVSDAFEADNTDEGDCLTTIQTATIFPVTPPPLIAKATDRESSLRLPLPVAPWCTQVRHRLGARSSAALMASRAAFPSSSPSPSSSPCSRLPSGITDWVAHKLAKKTNRPPSLSRATPSSSHTAWAPTIPIPTTLVDRARVQALVRLRCIDSSVAQPPDRWRHQGNQYNRAGLHTFGSVKTAKVEGQLATRRLHEWQARWHTEEDAPDAMSAATMEFLYDSVQRQRAVSVAGTRACDVASFLQPRTHDMERAVAQARHAIDRSRALRQEVQRVQAGAVACRCFSTDSSH